MEVKPPHTDDRVADYLPPFAFILLFFFSISNVSFFPPRVWIFQRTFQNWISAASHVANNSFVPLKSREIYEYRGFSVTDKADAFSAGAAAAPALVFSAQ